MDLSTMSLSELRKHLAKVEGEIRKRTDTTARDLLKKIKKLVDEQGVSLDEVMKSAGGASATATRGKRGATAGKKAGTAKKVGGKLPIKYRNPKDPSMGWSGHGRRPQWVLDLLAQGKGLDDLAKA